MQSARLMLSLIVSLSLLASSAEAKFVPPKQVPVALRDQLLVLTNGRGRYLIVPSLRPTMTTSERNKVRNYVFYGDAKHVYQQHLIGGLNLRKDGTFKVHLRDFRLVTSTLTGVLSKEPHMQCNEARLPLTQLSAGKARAFIDKVELHPPFWRREPHLLARDDEGRYFYVDRMIAHRRRRRTVALTELRGFRMFIGRRGRAREVKLRDTVLDAAGQIFLTKKGALHLETKTDKLFWRRGKKRTFLTKVPLNKQDTWILIHRYLGAYAGVRFQLPCEGL